MKISYRSIWSFSLAFYLIMSIGFGIGDFSALSSISLYLFLVVSMVVFIRQKQVKMNYFLYSLLLFLFVLFIGALYSPTPDEQILEIVYDYFTMFIICFCIFQYISSDKDIAFIINAMLVGTVVMSLYTYSLYGSAFWSMLRGNSIASENNIFRISGGRTGSGNANVLGTRNAIGFVVSIFFLFFNHKERKRKSTVLYSISAIICLIMAFASGSKKTIFIIILGVIFVVIIASENTQNGIKKIKYILGSILALGMIIYLIFTAPIFSGIASRIRTFIDFIFGSGDGGVSEVARSSLIETGVQVWLQNFFWGRGTYASYTYFGVYCHNNFVEILMNNGILGFALFYSGFVVEIIDFLRNRKKWWEDNHISGLLFSIFLSIFVCGYFFVFYYDRYMMIFILLACSSKRLFVTK